MLGLDNSGKTTIVANLNGGRNIISWLLLWSRDSVLWLDSTEGTVPSVGFSSTKMDLEGFQATLYDVGGTTRLQNIWNNYYSEVRLCE